MLTIAIYAGEYSGDESPLTYLCDIEGSAVPDGRPPFTTLEEAQRILEMCTGRWSTPSSAGPTLTVFVGHRNDDRASPLARLDIRIKEGWTRTRVAPEGSFVYGLTPVAVDSDDDVATIVLKILAGTSTDQLCEPCIFVVH